MTRTFRVTGYGGARKDPVVVVYTDDAEIPTTLMLPTPRAEAPAIGTVVELEILGIPRLLPVTA